MKKIKILLCTVLCILLTAAVVLVAGCGNEITLANLSVNNNSMKSDYTVGDAPNFVGGKLTAVYSDGSEKVIDVTADMVSGFDTSSAGEKYFTVTYELKSVRYYYTVNEKQRPEDPTPAPDYSYFTTRENDDGDLIITGLSGEYPRELFFPATIDNKKVVAVDGKTSDNKNAFSGLAADKIEVENGITRIGDNCFYNCKELDEVILPDSVTELGVYVFENNTSLEHVALGSGVKNLPQGTFDNCTTLVRVELSPVLEKIGQYAFRLCVALDEINLPETVQEVAGGAFMYCSVLREISLPNVEVISSYAFYCCTSLYSADIAKAKDIRLNAFYQCTAIETVDLSAAVEIGESAFEESGISEITLSDALTTLGDRAFFSSGLTKIVLPESLVSMGEVCFSNCESLTDATFAAPAEAFTAIPSGAFENCSNLKGFVIGENVTEIGESAFGAAGKKLTGETGFQLDWSNASKLRIIGGSAFMDTNLKGRITIPDSVEAIGYSAFQASKVEELYFGENSALTNLGNSVALYSSTLTKVTLPKGITEFSSGWFQYTALSELDLSATKITKLPDSTFSVYGAYDKLEKVMLPDTCTAIGKNAFSGKSNLTEVLGSGVKSLGDYAFQNCSKLTTLYLWDKLETVGISAFERCNALTTLTIGGNLKVIGDYAFQFCAELATVSISMASLTQIGENSFQGNAKLTSFELTGTAGGSVQMKNNVFRNCTLLNNVKISEGVSSLGSQMFSGCVALTDIVLPSSVTSYASSLFTGCSNLETVTLNISSVSVFGTNNLGWNSLTKMTAIYVPSELVTQCKEKFTSKAEIIKAIVTN